MEHSSDHIDWIKEQSGYAGCFESGSLDQEITILHTEKMTEEIKESIRNRLNRDVKFRFLEDGFLSL